MRDHQDSRGGRSRCRGWLWTLAWLGGCAAPPDWGPGPSPAAPPEARPVSVAPATRQSAIDQAWRTLTDGGMGDESARTRVLAIGARLRAVAAAVAPERGWPATGDTLSRQAEARADCLPDGRCVVSAGLLARLGGDDALLAAAMAHAMAHELRGHGDERIARAAANRSTDAGAALLSAFDRVHETEADRLGAELLARAGLEVGALRRLWPALARPDVSAGAGAGDARARLPAFSRDHPEYPSRSIDLLRYEHRLAPLVPSSAARP